jgi:hypothetical protein
MDKNSKHLFQSASRADKLKVDLRKSKSRFFYPFSAIRERDATGAAAQDVDIT